MKLADLATLEQASPRIFAEVKKLLEVARAALDLKRSGPCDGDWARATCICGPCKLDRALAALESPDALEGEA